MEELSILVIRSCSGVLLLEQGRGSLFKGQKLAKKAIFNQLLVILSFCSFLKVLFCIPSLFYIALFFSFFFFKSFSVFSGPFPITLSIRGAVVAFILKKFWVKSITTKKILWWTEEKMKATWPREKLHPLNFYPCACTYAKMIAVKCLPFLLRSF